MRYRRLDENGDYLLNTFLRDAPEVVGQAIRTRLLLITGEWFLNLTEGTPWYTQVLGKYTAGVYDAVIKNRIFNTPGVLSIDSYTSTLDPDTRALSVSAKVTTIYGITTFEVSL